MARNITDITNTMKEAFMASETLQALYGFAGTDSFDSKFSSVSIEAILINIVSTVAAAVENMFDWHKAEITNTIETERYGYKGWYEKKALEFQYGDGITNDYSSSDTEYAEGTEYDNTGRTDEDIEALRIIKYAYCEEQTGVSKIGVKLKVAKDSDGEFIMPEIAEQAAFMAYINRIKPGGMPVEFIFANGDVLTLSLTIIYNPLILKNTGEKLSQTGVFPVKDAILSYLHSIDFNGEFIGMKLIDAVQAVDGVEIAVLNSATATYASTTTVDITNEPYYAPYAGWMTLADEDLSLTFLIK